MLNNFESVSIYPEKPIKGYPEHLEMIVNRLVISADTKSLVLDIRNRKHLTPESIGVILYGIYVNSFTSLENHEGWKIEVTKDQFMILCEHFDGYMKKIPQK